MSHLLSHAYRVGLRKWLRLVSYLAELRIHERTPVSGEVPGELSGPTITIAGSTRSLKRSINERVEPGLRDSLTAQFCLAGVAVGLNFCNKANLIKKERLAGVVLTSAYLKHYCSQFDVPIRARAFPLIQSTRWSDGTERSSVVVTPDWQPLSRLRLVTKPPRAKGFVGRKEELSRLLENISSSEISIIFIRGTGGSGKTYHASRLYAEIKARHLLFWVDCGRREVILDTLIWDLMTSLPARGSEKEAILDQAEHREKRVDSLVQLLE